MIFFISIMMLPLMASLNVFSFFFFFFGGGGALWPWVWHPFTKVSIVMTHNCKVPSFSGLDVSFSFFASIYFTRMAR